MSILKDGQQITCDGEGCTATAFLPVGLNSLISPRKMGPAVARGWLFVTREGGCSHYCPCCIPRYMAALSGSAMNGRPEKEPVL